MSLWLDGAPKPRKHQAKPQAEANQTGNKTKTIWYRTYTAGTAVAPPLGALLARVAFRKFECAKYMQTVALLARMASRNT